MMLKKDLTHQTMKLKKPIPTGKKKKLIGLLKGELCGKIMTELVGLGFKTYSYLIDYGTSDKKVKGTNQCVIKLSLNKT